MRRAVSLAPADTLYVHTAEEARAFRDQFVELVRLAGHAAAPFGVSVAVTEALENALHHGNRGDPRKRVRVTYAVSGEQIAVEIEDEGPGFDPSEVPDPARPEHRERPTGRGLLLMRHYMETVAFLGRGNRVRMTRGRSWLPPEG